MVYYITDQIRTALSNIKGQAAPSKTKQQQHKRPRQQRVDTINMEWQSQAMTHDQDW